MFFRKHLVRYFILISLLASSNALYAQDYDWTATAGSGLFFSTGWGVTVDNNSNVITSGHFLGTTDFDPGPGVFNLTSLGVEDAFIQKLDPSGNLIWAVSMGGPDQNFAYNLTHDSDGNIYVVGGFNQTIDLDPGPGTFLLTTAGDLDVFILKLDKNGQFIWGKGVGSPEEDFGVSIELDNDGNIYVVGSVYGSGDFNPGPGVFTITPNGLSDAYILKLDPDGNFLWANSYGSADYDHGRSIVIDSMNNVIFAGNFDGTVDFDFGPGIQNVAAVGNQSQFLLKLTANGDFIWVKPIGATGFADNGVSAITKDRKDGFYVSGRFNGELTEGGLISTDPLDYFILKFDAAGQTIWVRQIYPETPSFIGLSIGIDTLGYIYTSGSFGPVIDLDPGIGIFEQAESDASIFIQKLDTAGNFYWGASVASTIRINTRDIYSDPLGNLHITGSYGGDADFDPGTQLDARTSLGPGDIFTMKLQGCELTFSSSIQTECDSYTTPNLEHTWTTSGLYKYTTPNMQGCDSLISVDLTINYSQGSTVDIIACDEYTGPSGSETWTSSGIYFDTISTSLGCDSLITFNLEVDYSTNSSIAVTACEEYRSPSGDFIWMTSGIYQDLLINSDGCDSLMTIDLTVNTLQDNQILVSGDTLISNIENANYQWVDCDSGFSLPGETNQIFIPSFSASYKVEVFQDGCTFESECQLFQYRQRECIKSVTPIPSDGPLSISLGDTYSEVRVELFDIGGRKIAKYNVFNKDKINWDINPSSGTYLLFVTCQDGRELKRVVFD